MNSNDSRPTDLTADELRAACGQLLENYKRAGLSRIAFDRRLLGLVKRSASTTASLPSGASPVPSQTSAPVRTAPPNFVAESPAIPSAMPTPIESRNSQDVGSPIRESAVVDVAKKADSSALISIGFRDSEKLSADQRLTVLNELNQQVCNCQLCPELVRNRTKTVFGVGNILPRIVFFGEAPGADEDKTGEPFVGKAGQLLTKIIEASQLKREDVYIMNSLKCRPPNNRTPTDTEIENCRLFFETQLAVLRPEFIVCLGAVAVRAVLNSTQSVGSLRGRFHQAYGARVMVTYHPSYLLRTESAKKYTWDDMKMLIAELGITLPGKN